MCMIDDADGIVNLIGDRNPVARKGHRCYECHRTIGIGERYSIRVGMLEGEWEVYKTCAHCCVLREWLVAECSGFLYGGVVEDFRDHAASGMYPMAVLRLAVASERQWRTRKGKLMPVPKMPATTHEVPP